MNESETKNNPEANCNILKEIIDKHNKEKQIGMCVVRVKKIKPQTLAEFEPICKSVKKYYKEI